MSFRLRAFKQSDFQELYKLDQQCFEPGIAYTRAELSSYIERKGSFTIVAEEPQATSLHRIAGFITVELHPKGYGHIITIDVRKQHRRSGLGSQLMQAAEEDLREAGAFMVNLEVAANNPPAIAFYKRHQYNLLNVLPRYYNGEIDGLFMSKRL